MDCCLMQCRKKVVLYSGETWIAVLYSLVKNIVLYIVEIWIAVLYSV